MADLRVLFDLKSRFIEHIQATVAKYLNYPILSIINT